MVIYIMDALLKENEELKNKVVELEEGLKKYTAHARSKKFYANPKEELLEKMKANPISSEKRKEYNKNYYMKKKGTIV